MVNLKPVFGAWSVYYMYRAYPGSSSSSGEGWTYGISHSCYHFSKPSPALIVGEGSGASARRPIECHATAGSSALGHRESLLLQSLHEGHPQMAIQSRQTSLRECEVLKEVPVISSCIAARSNWAPTLGINLFEYVSE